MHFPFSDRNGIIVGARDIARILVIGIQFALYSPELVADART
jgi:hypothetical protein